MVALGARIFIVTFLLGVLTPVAASAHGGGALDANGCHKDRRLDDYHCHRGKLRGKHFKSRADMLRMLKTGDNTAISDEHPGRFQDLAGALESEPQQPETAAEAPSAAAPATSGVASGPGSTAAARAPAAPVPSSLEERLAVLKRLYEKDLITKREYDEKRQELLDSL